MQVLKLIHISEKAPHVIFENTMELLFTGFSLPARIFCRGGLGLCLVVLVDSRVVN